MTILERNILIDGNNLTHRSHAVFVKGKSENEIMTSPSGYPTGFIYGIFSMLSSWIPEVSNPTRAVFFLDGRPVRRLSLDPDYKKKDPSHGPPGLDPIQICLSDGFVASTEMDIVTHLLSLLGIDVYHNLEEEADDLIASYVRTNSEAVSIIVSSDVDFYQMLAWNDRIIIFRPGVEGNRFFDSERAEEHILKRYKVRVPPKNMRMFKALTGDSSDGIPGIPRIRKKVAAPLCHYSSVNDLYASGLPGLSKAEKTRAEELRDRVTLNYELVGLNDSLDISKSIKKAEPDFKAASAILQNDLGIMTVFPHTFKFEQDGRVRSSVSNFALLPDFLQDI